MLIVSIDLGKFNSVACWYVVETQAGRFQKVPTHVVEFEELLSGPRRPDVVVVEACTMAGWVIELCQRLGLPTKVANTSGEAWKWKNVKRKTDRDDALKLARLTALGQLPEVRLPSAEIRQWRSLVKFRQRLVAQRVALQNHVRAMLLAQGLWMARGHRAWTAEGLASLAALHTPAEGAQPTLWQRELGLALATLQHLLERTAEAEGRLDALARANPRVKLLETIPGIGTRTAEVIVAFLDDPHRFTNGRQVAAYAGLVPRQYQSGESDRRGRITRHGCGLLRKMLVEAAWLACRYNDWARQTVHRLSRGQKKRRKQAVVALARKLLVRCWAMLRDNTCWRDRRSLTEALAGSPLVELVTVPATTT